jgi:hypothetical protein
LAQLKTPEKEEAQNQTVSSGEIVDKIATIAYYMEPTMAPEPGQQDPLDGALPSQPQASRDTMEMPPPPLPSQGAEIPSVRSSRATSPASRNTHRLSLTLPILPPTSLPTRPTPTSTTTPSYPPTPSEIMSAPILSSPNSADPADFIIAIAAQERRVLEIREELNQAEAELKRLKKQWAHKEAHKKRSAVRRVEPLRQMVPQRDQSASGGGDDSATRRSVEIDRRKALLQGQLSQQNTPGSSRRKVLRGGHTRTLSLLSPARPRADSSLLDEQSDSEQSSLSRTSTFDAADDDSIVTPLTPSTVSKRASWAPRSVHQATVTTGMKQLAEDMKLGLWTFVEDLRQVTVGAEPITGEGTDPRAVIADRRASPGHRRLASNYRYDADEQDTIRASGAPSRPRASAVFDDTPTPSSRFADVLGQDIKISNSDKDAAKALGRTDSISSRKAGKRQTSKRFSWAPLTVDSYEDGDWSNWDSPTVRSSRWSGSTVNGDIMPAIPPTIPKGNEGVSGPSPPRRSPLSARSRNNKRQQETSPTIEQTDPPVSPNKLEELLPGMLNRLTPGNLKRTAADLMKEWEKSLAPPATENGPGQAAQTTATTE